MFKSHKETNYHPDSKSWLFCHRTLSKLHFVTNHLWLGHRVAQSQSLTNCQAAKSYKDLNSHNPSQRAHSFPEVYFQYNNLNIQTITVWGNYQWNSVWPSNKEATGFLREWNLILLPNNTKAYSPDLVLSTFLPQPSICSTSFMSSSKRYKISLLTNGFFLYILDRFLILDK